MNKQQLGRPIFGIFRTLLFPNFAQIPHVQSAIRSWRSQNSLVMRRPLHLEDLIFMRLKTVQLQFEVTQIPESDSLICAARSQDEFGVRIETQTIHFGRVRVDGVRRFAGVVAPRVPDHEFLVICDRTEEAFVQQVPSYVFHNGGVACENGFRVDDAVFFRCSVDVPQTDGVVVACGE